jgi:hypothetical protein
MTLRHSKIIKLIETNPQISLAYIRRENILMGRTASQIFPVRTTFDQCSGSGEYEITCLWI